MFIMECKCGNEIFGNEEDEQGAWQCDECGQWYDLFGQPIAAPAAPQAQALFKDYDPDFEDED